MKKKITVLSLCAILLALCLPTHAQQTGKVARIGFLDNSTLLVSRSFGSVSAGPAQARLDRGKNITIEYRFSGKSVSGLPELAADLVRLNVDLIVTTGDRRR